MQSAITVNAVMFNYRSTIRLDCRHSDHVDCCSQTVLRISSFAQECTPALRHAMSMLLTPQQCYSVTTPLATDTCNRYLQQILATAPPFYRRHYLAPSKTWNSNNTRGSCRHAPQLQNSKHHSYLLTLACKMMSSATMVMHSAVAPGLQSAP